MRKFDYNHSGKDVKVAMRLLDNVIDDTYYFFKENEKCAKEIRRTGLGIIGLADALIKMKLRYGCAESEETLRKIFKTIRDNAYEASSEMAKEKGAFPKFDKEKYMKGYHIKELPKSIQKKIEKTGNQKCSSTYNCPNRNNLFSFRSFIRSRAGL